MLKFLKLVIAYSLSTIILMQLLDFGYTYYYYHPIKFLDKYSWVQGLDPSTTFDYALFGSSRCWFHLDPRIIESETGLKGINLGYAANGPLENYLMVEAFLNKFNPENIFIEVSDDYNRIKPKKVAIEVWLPYIKEDFIYNQISQFDYFYDRLIPFYRYIKNDSYIGFRNVSYSILGKDAMFIRNEGYRPKNGQLKNVKETGLFLDQEPSIYLRKILELCDSKNVNVHFFTSPHLKTNNNVEIIGKELPNYTNFIDSLQPIKHWHDRIHLNESGSKKFTSLFVRHYKSTLGKNKIIN